jgi:fucose permease
MLKSGTASRNGLLLVLAYLGFVSLGLPDTVLGAAWPAIRDELDLPLDAAGAAVLLTTCGVVLSSAASARVRARMGTGAVLIASTVLASLALLVSAAGTRWSHLLAASTLAGLGGGAIDATLNDHVARHHSARHMNWLHAFWGVGAAIAPLVVASALALGASWRAAYTALGCAEALLALSFVATRDSWSASAPARATAASAPPAHVGGAVRASVLMFFCYGGLEAGVGLWITTLLTLTRGSSQAGASAAVAIYWGALCAGRFLIGVVADRLGAERVLAAAVRLALVAALALIWPSTPAWFVALVLAALGAALAPIYPLAMHATPRRFGDDLGTRVVGYQVAAASVGVAVLPWLLGALSRALSILWLPPALAVLALGVVLLERARRGTTDRR